MDDWLLKWLRIGLWIGLVVWLVVLAIQKWCGTEVTDRALIMAAIMLVGAINCEHTAALLRNSK